MSAKKQKDTELMTSEIAPDELQRVNKEKQCPGADGHGHKVWMAWFNVHFLWLFHLSTPQ